jgi:hypothetical protein
MYIVKALPILLMLGAAGDHVIGGTVTWNTGYIRHQDIPVGAALKGSTAPSEATIGTTRCVQFNQSQTGETVYLQVRVPSDWNATSDLDVDLHTYPEAGDALANGEVIEFTVTYRSVSATEPYDNGSVATFSVTYTQSGAGVDKAGMHAHGTLAYNNANQPLANDDEILMEIDLHEVNTTYSGNPYLCFIHLTHTAVRMPQN